MLRNKKRATEKKAQVILEFTFCMIVVLLMIFGVTKVFFWAGHDLARRSRAHDEALLTDVDEHYVAIEEGPARQVDEYFYTPVKMNAIWDGD